MGFFACPNFFCLADFLGIFEGKKRYFLLRLFYTSKYHNGTYRKCGEKAVSSSSISEGISGNRQGFGSNSKKFLSILQKPVLRLGIPSLRSSMTEKKGNVILNRRDSGVVKNPATPAVLFVPVERMDPSAMPQDDEKAIIISNNSGNSSSVSGGVRC